MAELSIHFERVETPATQVVLSSSLSWVYVVNPPGENVFPGKRVVGRIYDEYEQELVAQGANGADEWWRWNGGKIPNYLYAIITCNEPNAAWETVDEYMRRWIALCRVKRADLKVVAGNFSTGCCPTEPGEARKMFWSMSLADYWGFHEYWVPEMMDDLPAWADWMMWRYKKFVAAIGIERPILITECGCDALAYDAMGKKPREEGWKVLYKGDRDWYLRHISVYYKNLDNLVLAVFIYEAGPYSRWQSYEVDTELARGIVSLNQGGKEETLMPPTIRVLRKSTGKVETMNVEDYLKKVLPSEVFPSWPFPALKANAIWQRSWAMYHIAHPKHADVGADVCDSAHCQVYNPARSHDRTNSAVTETAGEVLVDKVTGEIVAAFYSAACGGKGETGWDPEHLVGHAYCPCESRHERNGHGHGGCQYGSYYLAQQERTMEEIINFYFKNCAIVGNYGADFKAPQNELENRVVTLEGRVDRLVGLLRQVGEV